MKMHQIGVKGLQPAFQLFKLVLKFPFYFWSLSCFVADVDIHHVPRRWEKIPKEGPQALSMLQILHLQCETQPKNSALHRQRTSYG